MKITKNKTASSFNTFQSLRWPAGPRCSGSVLLRFPKTCFISFLEAYLQNQTSAKHMLADQGEKRGRSEDKHK